MDQTESDTGYTEEMLDSSGTTTGENTSMMIVGALREESLVGVKETNWTADGSKVCDLCGKSFARHALMMNHRRVHTGEKPFLCDVCEQRFREKSHLIRHMRVHRTERPFTCDVDDCNKTFTDKYYLAQHKLTHSDSKRLLCSSCGYRCSQPSDFKKHLRTHTREKPYTCELCGKAFTQKITCLKHQKSIHKKDMQPSPSED